MERELGLVELTAIALGGMIGGGIFAILGVAVERVGNAASLAILIGGVLAFLAAVPYVRLTRLYKDEGATYSFFKRTFADSRMAASVIGWLVVFGYVATLGLYAFTFASYLASLFPTSHPESIRLILSGTQLATFALLNIISVRLMGRVEDLMVYVKVTALIVLAAVLFWAGDSSNATLPAFEPALGGELMLVAAITFVAFEGFQLAIHAYEEVKDPQVSVPRAIYAAIVVATLLYVLLAEGALWSLDKAQIIADKEYALAAGAAEVLGRGGHALVIASALLATSSAVSGTLFGASRLAAVIALDGYLPAYMGRRRQGHVPAAAIVTLAAGAWLLVLSGRLELIVEFGSLVFIAVSLLMAVANWRVREQTQSSQLFCWTTMLSLAAAGMAIVGWQAMARPDDLVWTLSVAGMLTIASVAYGTWSDRDRRRPDGGAPPG